MTASAEFTPTAWPFYPMGGLGSHVCHTTDSVLRTGVWRRGFAYLWPADDAPGAQAHDLKIPANPGLVGNEMVLRGPDDIGGE